jgi:hypothetical protein
MTIQPPAIGARLLKRLVPARDHDALLGDLFEEYQRRRSVLWYGLQILAAIVVGSRKDIRTHRLLTLGAIGVGVASLVLYFYAGGMAFNVVLRRLNEGILVGNHWIYWRPQPPRFTVHLLPLLFLHFGFLVSGWVIGQLYRAHGITFVVAFATFVQLTISQPPRFAGRLLKRLVPGQDHDVLIGDLNEEYQRGRSTTWYLLQILAAIVVGTWRDLRANPLVAVRAAVTGVVAQLLVVFCWGWLLEVFTGAGFMWGGRWIGLPWFYHWPYASSLDRIMYGLWIVGELMIGWLIVRLHRGHSVMTVLAFSCVMFAIRAETYFKIAFVMGPQPFVRGLSSAMVIGQISETLLLILGGYLATRRPGVA